MSGFLLALAHHRFRFWIVRDLSFPGCTSEGEVIFCDCGSKGLMIALSGAKYKLSSSNASCHTEYQFVVVNYYAILQPFKGNWVIRTLCYLIHIQGQQWLFLI